MLKSVPVTLLFISYIDAFSVCYSITYIVKFFSPEMWGHVFIVFVLLGGRDNVFIGRSVNFTIFLADIFIMFVMTVVKTVLNCGETVFYEF